MSDLTEVGNDLTAAVEKTLAALEGSGLSAEDADDFIHDCIFQAWWNWDYRPTETAKLASSDSTV